MKYLITILTLVLVAGTALGQFGPDRRTYYPVTSSPLSTDYLVIARPGVTQYNVPWSAVGSGGTGTSTNDVIAIVNQVGSTNTNYRAHSVVTGATNAAGLTMATRNDATNTVNALVPSIMATNAAGSLATSIRHYTNAIGGQVANESNFVSYISGHAWGSAAFLTNTPGNGHIWAQLPVPPRTISSFPSGACSVTESWVSNKITEIKTNGMLAAGWDTIFLEDGQYNSNRVGGLLQFDTAKFPSGPAWLNTYANSNGVKLWSYLSHSAIACCSEGNPGSPAQYLASDIAQNVGWGFHGLIIDECIPDQNVLTADRMRFVGRVFNEVVNNYFERNTNNFASARHGMALLATSTKNPTGGTYPNTGDNWESVPAESMYNMNVIAVPWYFGVGTTFTNWLNITKMCERYNWAVGPGHYLGPTSFVPQALNDKQLTVALNFYTMMCAPIQLGAWTANNFYRLNNQEVRQIHQHKDVIPGITISSNATTEVMARPIGSGTNFVLLINKASTTSTVTFNPALLGIRNDQRYVVRDPWSHYDIVTTNGIYQRSVQGDYCEALTIRVLPDIVSQNDLSTNGLTAWLSFWNKGYGTNEVVPFVYDLVNPSATWAPYDTFAPVTTTNAGLAYYTTFTASTAANLRNGFATISQPYHVFMVFKTPTNSAAATLFDGTNNTARSTAFTLSGSLYFNAGSQISAVVGNAGNTIVAEFYANAGSSYIRTNGVLAVSGNIGANGLNGITVGADYSGFQETSSAKTEIGDVIVASGTLSTTQITTITNHLLRKFSLASPQVWVQPESAYAGTFVGQFTGNGSGLTNIPATALATGGTLPVLNATNLTNVVASSIRIGGTLPALNASSLTNISATSITSASGGLNVTNSSVVGNVGLTNGVLTAGGISAGTGLSFSGIPSVTVGSSSSGIGYNSVGSEYFIYSANSAGNWKFRGGGILGTDLAVINSAGSTLSSKLTVSDAVIATNGFFLPTKTAPPAAAGGGYLWNSNSVLYWVTATKTNQVSDGR